VNGTVTREVAIGVVMFYRFAVVVP